MNPTTTITVTNNSGADVYVNGTDVAASGGQLTATGVNVAPVCTDINFRLGFIAGNLELTINGIALTASDPGAIDLLDGLASGLLVVNE